MILSGVLFGNQLAGFGGLFLFALRLFFGQSKEGSDLRTRTVMVLPFFELGLAFHRESGERKGLKAVVTNRLFADFAHTVGSTLDSFKRFVNLVK